MGIIKNQTGGSLIDLLVTMAIIAVISAFAIPNHSGIKDSFNRGVAIAQVDSDLRRARAEAVAAGARAIFKISLAQNTYEVGLDFSPYQASPTIETTRFRGNLPTGITISSSADIIYDPRGYVIDSTGATTQLSLSFAEDSTTYKTGTLYAAGYLDF